MRYCFVSLVLIILQVSAIDVHYRLYHSDRVSDSDLYYDCLLHNAASKFQPSVGSRRKIYLSYQINPFCTRSLELHHITFAENDTRAIHGTPIKFETLQKQNVTSQQLYLLSAPIDVVERYQEFLENSNQSLSNQIYYNCSRPWFGEFCQYMFDWTLPFDEIVYRYFRTKESSLTNGACYIFTKCNRGALPSCLDWREICDGKIDCLDGGEDELNCDEFDSNECTKDEYRCGNGLCVPNDFFNDDPDNPDCIDRSDEKDARYLVDGFFSCSYDPTFRCEETACRNERMLACGDGQCAVDHCYSQRDKLLWRAKLSWSANLHLSFDCWTTLICLTITSDDRIAFFDSVNCTMENVSERFVRENCPSFFFFPAQPMILDHVRFAYTNNFTNIDDWDEILLPEYVCYDQQLCESLPSTVGMNDSGCRSLSELNLNGPSITGENVESRMLELFLKCSMTKNSYIQCPTSKPFRCANSTKCLALNRLLDGFSDCFEGDDEQIKDSCSLPDAHYRFKCSSENKCIPLDSLNNRRVICVGGEDAERDIFGSWIKSYSLSFQTLCDGFVEHTRVDGLNYTDEMHCEHWPCRNAYTRCDSLGTWNCRDGADEADCSSNPCGPDGHPCILPHSYNFTCLPLNRSNDGHVDCVGSYDERGQCSSKLTEPLPNVYRCFNQSKCLSLLFVCDRRTKHCAAGDDEGEWCTKQYNMSNWMLSVGGSLLSSAFDMKLYLFHLLSQINKPKIVHFKLTNHLKYPTLVNTTTADDFIARSDKSIYNSNPRSLLDEPHAFCHRGILIHSGNSKEKSCLCPPAYFGYRCEYQSQRVSLTLQFLTTEWRAVLTFVMMLIDNDTNINSYEEVDYLSVRDCRKKFNFYLLYSTRPKHHNRTYYVRIDVYDKVTMKYYVSMFYPIRFSFLPVHRLSLQVNVPVRESLTISKKCPLKCIHGQCTRYVNMDKFFCRCFNGSSGTLCTVKNDCHCSSDSICVGTINNRSMCVCPLNKFGPRCYLGKTICSSSPCLNNGRCVAADEKISESGYFCVCPEGFIGLRCEKAEMKIEFHFTKDIIIPQSILIHFVEVLEKYSLITLYFPAQTTQTTMISKIGFDQISTVVYYSETFHLIFVEFHENYYLALLQHNYTSFVSISTRIIPEHRCAPISELVDNHILDFPTWRRAKHYHIPCQQRSDLVCFYDNDQFMCLCDIDRHANCFKFNYRRVYNCSGYNYCENDGQCYQNHNTCPTSSSCFCNECHYGTRCQFTSTGFGLTLDSILGYSIWPNVLFSRQPIIVHVSAAFTVVMFVFAIINGVLSMITFRTKRSLQVGCGFYLLASSITSCLTMTMFALQFLLLILSQMSMITNHSFLLFNCNTMDMLLKALLAIGDWLNACVAIERTLTIQLGVRFNKKKSRKIAKWLICGVCLFTLTSYIHDPVHRHLLENNEEQRKWCVVRYSSSMKAFSSFVNIIHFLVPLSINVITVLLIIILAARQKLKVGKKQTYREHLWKQFHQHKHRLISSFILIIIAIPRLLITFVSKCMKTTRSPWLYLGGYFVSFVPPLLVFVVFVLPSQFYRTEFNEATIRLKKSIQCRFRRA